MSATERRKGADGERELRRLLTEHLGEGITRNLEQSRDGGADLLGCGPFSIEVKRQERLELAAWWRQSCDQAARAGLLPALAYRRSRQPWRFVVPIGVLLGNSAPMDCQAVATLELDGFVLVVRESGNAVTPVGYGRILDKYPVLGSET